MNENRMSSTEEDRELVKISLRGEREAFEMLIQRYQQPLLNYIGRMVRNVVLFYFLGESLLKALGKYRNFPLFIIRGFLSL